MRGWVVIALLWLLMCGVVRAQGTPGCQHLDIGDGTLMANVFTVQLSGVSGVDPDAPFFPIGSLNGTYTLVWVYDALFAPPQLLHRGTAPGAGQNADPVMRMIRNRPVAGQTELWIASGFEDGGYVYARYRVTQLPGITNITLTRIFQHEYAEGFPGSITAVPCVEVPPCDEECDPTCRANLDPPNPCNTTQGQNVCAECWCDPSWRYDHGNPCPDVSPADGICDGVACNCDPTMRAYLGHPCEDANFDGRCDDCDCVDENANGVCDDCDPYYRPDCDDVNPADGWCDDCEHFEHHEECEDDDRDGVCNECDVQWMQNYFGGCADANANGVCDYCETAGNRGIPEMNPPGVNLQIPYPEFGDGFVDLDIAIPIPGSGYGQYRLSTEPSRMLGYGNMPGGTFLGYAIEKLVLARGWIRFALLLFVTWVFVIRVVKLLFNM